MNVVASPAAAASAQERAPARSPWIVGMWADLALFVATPLLILPLFLLLKGRFAPVEMALLVVALGGVGHHLPGMMRAYGDRELFRRYRLRFTLAPLALVTVCVLAAWYDLAATALVAAFWALWHSLAQTYGFLRIYDAKAGSFDARTRLLDRAMCVAWFVGGAIFSAPRLAGILSFVYESGGPLLSPAAVAGLRDAWMVGTGVVTVLFLANWLDGLRRGKAQSPIKLLLLGTSIAFWWFCMTSFPNVIIGIALFEIFHDSQYLGIVWVYNGNRLTKNPDQWGFMRFAFRRSGVLLGLYVALVLLYGYGSYVVSGLEQTKVRDVLLGVVLSSTLLHYYYDGFIWRVREKGTRESLGVKSSGAGDARELAPARVGLPAWARHGAYWSLFGLAVGGFAAAQMSAEREELEWRQAIVDAVPDSAIARHNLAAALQNAGRVDEALTHYERAVALDPDYAVAHAHMGEALLALGRGEQALAAFRAALALEPQDAAAKSGLARALHLDGQHDAAIAAYREGLAGAPGDAETRARLAGALAASGRMDEAERELQRAREAAPASAVVLSEAAALEARRGRQAEAAELWRRALAARPGDARAQLGLAQSLHALGRVEEALGHYESALAGDEPRVEMRWNQGLALQTLGRDDEALAVFRRVVELDPGYAKARNSVGLLLAARGELDAAIAEYRAALALEPDYVVARANLGLALQASGDLDGGVAELRRAVELAPDYAKGHFFLGLLLEAQGARADARAALERALALDPTLAQAREARERLR